ncbi:TonB-dependent receptor [Sphingobium subterraneum]|uniref:TonB-dependent receptor n=1 Tax=Sphingobium subterraneum TaxID=627688 RepID=A0A841J068_9SPHN|nr:TonB-dependent receptor [Sphingobium subterraneum]MBB6124074.1 hypothetical protein [Sphingobium subterraneum]
MTLALTRSLLLTTVLTPFLVAPALAQITTEPRPDQATTAPAGGGGGGGADPALNEGDEADEDIVVTGTKLPGSVVGNIPAEVTFTGRDVRGLGVSNITELLDALAPQTASSRGRGNGRPVVLINGLRTTGFAEVRDLPTEAIARVEIYPEELALRYGYRADQRVVNIVLRARFRAVTAELGPSITTDGGGVGGKADVTLLRIDKAGRWSLNTQYQHVSPLYENDRDIAPPVTPGALDERAFRTLVGRTDTASVNGTLNRNLGNGLAGTLNIRGETSTSENGLGGFLPVGTVVAQGLRRHVETQTGHAGAMISGAIAPWQFSVTANYDITHTRSRSDRALSPRDTALSTDQVATLELVTSGPLLKLPAGNANVTVKAGGDLDDFEGRSLRSGIERRTDVERATASGQASFDIPIASARRDVLAPLGTLNANFNIAYDRLSDFGTLRTLGYGISWSPVPVIDLVASVTHEDGAPTVQQLGGPTESIANVRVFDYVRQETVNITQISGGNPFLTGDNRRVLKLGATVRPFGDRNISFSANYTKSRIRNVIASLPAPTATIEAAFPDRFVRDANGQLISIDTRPVNFARSDQEELRWGVNLTKTFGQARRPDFAGGGGRSRAGGGESRAPGGAEPPPPGTEAAGAPPPPEGGPGGRGGFPGGGRGFGGGGGGGFGQTRLQFSFYHTWHLREDILIAPGVPLLDLLDGATTGNSGGQPRHELEGRLGVNRNGLGARVDVNWQSATSVTGGSAANASSLRFSPLATVDLRLFASLGANRDLVKRMPWLRGTRVTFSVDNLFNQRQNVRNANGLVPVNYQPDYLDPSGRTIRLTIRKLFF